MDLKSEDLKYNIAIGLIPGVGPVTARKLLSLMGSAIAVFKESPSTLALLPQLGKIFSNGISFDKILDRAKQETDFIEKYGIKTYFCLDDDYPTRLAQSNDSPVILYQKGDIDLNTDKIISIVGTRRATQRGKDITRDFVKEISERHPGTVVVSGLAYGIDVTAHRAALEFGLDTAAVMANGLSTIYPSDHREVAKKISRQGALLTEFLGPEKPEKPSFIKRNRIIAGLSDALIVVESGVKGGAMVTANQANSYSRDVFAFPGRVNDKWSRGCNRLILTNRAALIEDASNFEYMMGWQTESTEGTQTELTLDLNPREKILLELLEENEQISLDEIAEKTAASTTDTFAILLDMELKGLIRSLPGKMYALY